MANHRNRVANLCDGLRWHCLATRLVCLGNVAAHGDLWRLHGVNGWSRQSLDCRPCTS